MGMCQGNPEGSASSGLRELIESQIKDNKVMMFSKSSCPYCNKAKSALKAAGIEYTAVEMNKVSNGSKMQDELQRMSGQRTVPNIYVMGNHIGGCDDTLAALKNGRLKRLLNS